MSISPDGSRFVSQVLPWPEFGPLEVRDVRTGGRLIELEGVCTWDSDAWNEGVLREETGDCNSYPEPPFPVHLGSIDWSPDGTMIAALDDFDRFVMVWDAADGRMIYAQPPDADWNPQTVLFSPDSETLLVSSERTVRQLSTDTWTVIREAPLGDELQGGDRPGLVGCFAEVVNRVAYAHERVRVVRRGRELAAIVPMADIELLETLEDEIDLAAAREALSDPANARPITWEEARARLER